MGNISIPKICWTIRLSKLTTETDLLESCAYDDLVSYFLNGTWYVSQILN